MNRASRRALVCDDDPSIRRVVGALLAELGYEIVAEVDLATDAVEVASFTKPDVVVLDVALMGMSGIEAIPHLRAAAPASAIVVFSAFDCVRAEAMAAGACAVVDKTAPLDLDAALHRLALLAA